MPLVATLVGKDVRVDPAADAVDALRFILRWIEDPSITYPGVPDDIGMGAMLKLATIHISALHDDTQLDHEDAELGLDGAARELVRVNGSRDVRRRPTVTC